jgi:predicted Fe-Mo cluster-binding NifX family protein
MKVAVSASGPDLSSPVDPRFGRCQYLAIVDTDTMEFESIPNQAVSAAGGAGISAAQQVVEKGVGAVLTGRCGPNAYQVFQASGVEVVQGAAGTVEEAVQRYKSGELSPGPQARWGGGSFGRRPPAAQPRKASVEELQSEVQGLKERLEKLTQTLEELRRTSR